MDFLMDHIPPRERDFAVDLESCGNTSEEAGSRDPISGARLAKTFFTKVYSGFVSVDGSVKGEYGLSLSSNASISTKVSPKNEKLLIDKKVGREEAAVLAEKKTVKDKCKKTSAKKPPKPPLPPRGLSLDATDQKLIKEIAELAMMKRARIERMKALKKMKATKAPSSNGNLFAMLFTILFCLVIIFQGVSSGRGSGVSFQGSLDSVRATESGFISVHDHWNSSVGDTNLPGSGSPSLVERISGSDPEGNVSRAAG